MKIAATKFYCDTVKCHNEFVSTDRTEAGPYIDLVEAGWRVRRLYNGWKHFCPDHKDDPIT